MTIVATYYRPSGLPSHQRRFRSVAVAALHLECSMRDIRAAIETGKTLNAGQGFTIRITEEVPFQ